MKGELVAFPRWQRQLSPEQARPAVDRMLAIPIAERPDRAKDLTDPEALLCLCGLLRDLYETSPAMVRQEAEFFYDALARSNGRSCSFDEREYFLGELAMIAGTACRFLFRRDEASRWFSRSEANFVLAQNTSANVARLAYQKLALALEERRLDEVLELAPVWTNNLVKFGLLDDALKCRFLEALASWETGKLSEAAQLFEIIRADAEKLGKDKQRAQAANNAAMVYALLGERDKSLQRSREALPLFQSLQDFVGIVKLQWGMGNLLRGQGNGVEAVAAYKASLRQAEEIGLRGDVAALHLIIADLLLEIGSERQAEWEIRAALPIIDEERMVPEGMAALTLLRESLKRRQINRQALRELHGYFLEPAS